MKLDPVNKHVIGRIAITKRAPTAIHLAEDINKGVSKFVLLEELSPEAIAAGYIPGNMVLPTSIKNIFLKGGAYHRATFSIDEIICKLEGVSIDDFIGPDGKPIPEKESAA